MPRGTKVGVEVLLGGICQEMRVDDGGSHDEQDVGIEVLLDGNGLLVITSLSTCTATATNGLQKLFGDLHYKNHKKIF